jgi:FkbM family methyltransferase
MKRMSSGALRVLPIPGTLKWCLADRVGGLLESGASYQAVAHMREGFDMRLNIGESYERAMYYSGLYNPYLTRLFKRLLTPGDTVVDGGANIGYFSLLAARRLGHYGSVHSFEPIPATFDTLCENIRLNGYTTITANCQALAQQAGELHLEVPVEAGTSQSLGRLATIAQRAQGPQIRAQTVAIDDYADSMGITSIKLAKLDIEGSEVAAIAGMRRLLSAQRIAYLLCELNTILLDLLNIPRSAMRHALNEHGYEAYYVRSVGGYRRRAQVELVPVMSMKQPDIYGDYLFVAAGAPRPSGV